MATIIQFRFPECQKVDIKSIIPQASEAGLQLLDELLQWDPEKRPSAQQSLKYTFFHVTKPSSEPVHTTLTKQQQNLGRNQGFQDDRVSHISLDDTDRYSKDNMSYRHYEQFNTVYQYSNNFKSMNNRSDHSTKHSNEYSTNSDIPKWTKPIENGYNSSFQNNSNKSNSSLNNNYRLKMSVDDNDDDDDDAMIGVKREKKSSDKNPFGSKRNTSDTGFYSTITTQDSQVSAINQQNYSNDATNGLNGTETIFNRAKSKEHMNHLKQRRNSQLDQNGLLNEKISDIYVNRDIGKLYEKNARGSIFDNKIYNGSNLNEINDTHQNFIQKNHSFFLHERKSGNENKDSKIYNIFSKQRLTEPRRSFQSMENGEENSYLSAKLISDVKSKPKKSITILDEQKSLFEDEQLDDLLG